MSVLEVVLFALMGIGFLLCLLAAGALWVDRRSR